MARVAIIGAGVVGVASAYRLCKEGHKVTLIDRHGCAAWENSRSNGAQLSYGYCDALASPGLLRNFPAILCGRDPAYRVRLQTDPAFLLWGLKLFSNGIPPRFLANTRHLLELASRSATVLRDLLLEFDLAFDYKVAGKMILYSDGVSYSRAEPIRHLKQSIGINQETLSRQEATALEASLGAYRDEIAHVVYHPDDAVGRPDRFCDELIDKLKGAYGLTTIFGHEVRRLIARNNQVAAVSFSSRAELDCEAIVVATGFMPRFLRWWESALRTVWPIRGYSVTGTASEVAMQTSITDLKRKIVFARVGTDLRIAGLADIAGDEPEFDDERLAQLNQLSNSAFDCQLTEEPADGLRASAWAGNRPCTPNSQPIIRRGKLRGLYLNIGHGTLGWTLSLGSAEKLVSILSEDFPNDPRRSTACH